MILWKAGQIWYNWLQPFALYCAIRNYPRKWPANNWYSRLYNTNTIYGRDCVHRTGSLIIDRSSVIGHGILGYGSSIMDLDHYASSLSINKASGYDTVTHPAPSYVWPLSTTYTRCCHDADCGERMHRTSTQNWSCLVTDPYQQSSMQNCVALHTWVIFKGLTQDLPIWELAGSRYKDFQSSSPRARYRFPCFL